MKIRRKDFNEKIRSVGSKKAIKYAGLLSIMILGLMLASSSTNSLNYPLSVFGKAWIFAGAVSTPASTNSTGTSASPSVSESGPKVASNSNIGLPGSVASEMPAVTSYLVNQGGNLTYYTNFGSYTFLASAPEELYSFISRTGVALVQRGAFGVVYTTAASAISQTSLTEENPIILVETNSVYSIQYTLVNTLGIAIGNMTVTYQFMYDAVNGIALKPIINASFVPANVTTSYSILWITIPAAGYSYVSNGIKITSITASPENLATTSGIASLEANVAPSFIKSSTPILKIDWSDYGKLTSGVTVGNISSFISSILSGAVEVQFPQGVDMIDPSYYVASTQATNAIGLATQGRTWYVDDNYWMFYTGSDYSTSQGFEYTSSPNGTSWPNYSFEPFAGVTIDGVANATCPNSLCTTTSLSTSNIDDVCIVTTASTQGDNASSVTDTANLTWTEKGSEFQYDPGNSEQVSIWYALTGPQLLTSDQATITWSHGVSTHADSATFFCANNVNNASPFDSNSNSLKGAYSTSGTPSVSGVSTTDVNDLVFAIVGWNTRGTETAGSGFSLVQNPNDKQNLESSATEESQFGVALSSYTVSFGTSLSTRWTMLVAALQCSCQSEIQTSGDDIAVTYQAPLFYVAIADGVTSAYIDQGVPLNNGTIFWEKPQALTSSGYLDLPSIAIDSNGNIWTSYYDYSSSTPYDAVYNGTTLVKTFPIDSNITGWQAGSDEAQPMMLESLNSSKIMAIWGNVTGSCCEKWPVWNLFSSVYSSGSFGSATTLSSNLTNAVQFATCATPTDTFCSDWFAPFTTPEAAAVGYNNSVYLAYANLNVGTEASYIEYRMYNGSTSTWSSATTAVTMPTDDQDNNIFGIPHPTLSFVPQPKGLGDIYIFYGGNFSTDTVDNLFYTTYNETANTWSGLVNYYNATSMPSDTATYSWGLIDSSPVSTLGGNSTGQLGVVVVTGLSSPLTIEYTPALVDPEINYNAVNSPSGSVNTGQVINAIQASQDYLTRLEKANGSDLAPSSTSNFVTESEYPSIPITVYYYNSKCYNAINAGGSDFDGNGSYSQGDQCLPILDGEYFTDSISNVSIARNSEAFDYSFQPPDDSHCSGTFNSPELLVNITWYGYGGKGPDYQAMVSVRPVAFADSDSTCKVDVYLANTEILAGVGHSSSTWTKTSAEIVIQTHPLDGAAIFGQGSVINGFSFNPYASNGVSPIIDLSSFRYTTRSGTQSGWKWSETALQPEYGYPTRTNDPTIYSTSGRMQNVVFNLANPAFNTADVYTPQFLMGQQLSYNYGDSTSAYQDCSQTSSTELPDNFYSNLGTVYPYASGVCTYPGEVEGYLMAVWGYDPLVMGETAIQVADTYGPNDPLVYWQGSNYSPAEFAWLMVSDGWINSTYGAYYPTNPINDPFCLQGLCPGSYFNGDRTAILAQLFTILGYRYGLTSYAYDHGTTYNFQTYANDMVNAMINAQWGMDTSNGNSGCPEGCGEAGTSSTNYFRPMDIGGEDSNWLSGWASTPGGNISGVGESYEYTGINPTEQESTQAMLAALLYYYNTVTMTASSALSIQNGIQPFDDVMFNGQGIASYEFVNRTFSLDGAYGSTYANIYIDARDEGDTLPRSLTVYLDNVQVGTTPFTLMPGGGYQDDVLSLNGSQSVLLENTHEYTLGIRLDSPGTSLSNSTKQYWWVISATIGKATTPKKESFTVDETGLPTDTAWSVAITNETGTYTQNPTGTSAVFKGQTQYETISWQVDNLTGYYPCYETACYDTGNVTMNSATAISVTFYSSTPASYSATFNEGGLESGTLWKIQFYNNSGFEQILSAYAPVSIVFNDIPAGTYEWAVFLISGYTVSPSSGSVVVNASTPAVDITFTPVSSCTPDSPPFQWLPDSPSESGASGSKTAYIALTNDGCVSYEVVGAALVVLENDSSWDFYTPTYNINTADLFSYNLSIEVPDYTGTVNVVCFLVTTDGTVVSTQPSFPTTLP